MSERRRKKNELPPFDPVAYLKLMEEQYGAANVFVTDAEWWHNCPTIRRACLDPFDGTIRGHERRGV